MRQPPPEVVASWPAPNYVDPVTRGPALVIVELLALSISTICLILRLFVRVRIVRSVDWDDWLMIAAAIFGAGVTTCVVMASSQYGWDLHIWDVTPAKLVASRQISFAAQALFVLATPLAKISIFASYLRLAPVGTWFRRLSYVGIGFAALTNFAFLVALFSQCRPFASYWDLTRSKTDCYNESPVLLANSILAAALDIFVWVLPLPTLLHTSLPLAQRIALLALFSFGLVVVFAACIRIYWIHYVLEQTYDVTWYGFHLWLWTAVEVQLGLICGCVPWLKPFFKRWWVRRATGGTGSGMGPGGSGPAHRSKSEGNRTAMSKRSNGMRLDSLAEVEVEREEDVDLERASVGSDSQVELRSDKARNWP